MPTKNYEDTIISSTVSCLAINPAGFIHVVMLTNAHNHFPTVLERRLRDAAVYCVCRYQKGHSGAAYARQKHKINSSVSFFMIFMKALPLQISVFFFFFIIQQGKLEKDNQTTHTAFAGFVLCFFFSTVLVFPDNFIHVFNVF